MFRKFEFQIMTAAIFTVFAVGMFSAVPAWTAPSGGVTKGAFVQRYFLDKFKRPPAARRYVPEGVEKLSPKERYQAVAKSLAEKGIMTLLGSRPEQPLSRVEYITLTYLLAGGTPGTSLAQQKAFLKSRGVLNKYDIGHVKSFQGNITVTRDGDEKAIKITGAEPVIFRDLDETDFGARIELQLDDGSILIIGEDTVLKIDEMIYDPKTNRRSVKLRMTIGNIRVKVSKNTVSGSKFQVVTPTTVTGVRGTEFTVSVDEQGTTRVLTLEGAVAVRPLRKSESRPTSKTEQEQGAPTEQEGDETASGETSTEETLVTAGQTTEVTAETTTVETTTASDEEIQQVTEATEITEPTETASVSTTDTQATEDVVQVETTESTTDTVTTTQETSEQTDTQAFSEDLGEATEEVTTTGSIGDSALATSSTPTSPVELTGLSGADLKSAFLSLSGQQQAETFGTLTTAQQQDIMGLLTQGEAEALLARFQPDSATSTFTEAVLDSLLDFGAVASAAQVGFVLDNITVAQAVGFIKCDGTQRDCIDEKDHSFFTDGNRDTFTSYGQGVVNSLDDELHRLDTAGGGYILATAGGSTIPANFTDFRVASELLVNLDEIPENADATFQTVNDIWGGKMTPTNYSVNGGYQAGQLRSTAGGGGGSGLINVSTRVSALNNDGFLSYAVQVEEDIVNTAALAIRSLSSGAYAAGTLNSLVDTQLAMSDIRTRDGLLASEADARAGVVLQGSGGERVRVQQYIYRSPSNTDEIRMTSVGLSNTDLSYLDIRAAFQSGGLSGKSALQIRALPWSDYFTQGFTDTAANCNISNCSAAVVSPGGGQPLLDTLSMEMGNGAGDYIREKMVLENSITAANLYTFGGTSLGGLNTQLVTFMELVTRQSGAGAKTFTLNGAGSPILYKPHEGSTLGPGGIAAGEFRIIPRQYLSGAPAPAAGHPDGFYYVLNDSGTTREYSINFAVVGDATTSSNTGVQTSSCGSGGGSSCGSIAFDNIWSAIGVNQPTSAQGLTAPNIGANILEIKAGSGANGELSAPITNYLIPWPRMIWRGESGF